MSRGPSIKLDENGRAIPLTHDEMQEAAAGLFRLAQKILERNRRTPLVLRHDDEGRVISPTPEERELARDRLLAWYRKIKEMPLCPETIRSD